MIQHYILANMIGFFAGSAIPILMSPIYFRYFGATDFGLIATVNGILVLTSVMDFGIASVLSQRLAGKTRKHRIVISIQDFRLYVGLTACLSTVIGGAILLFLMKFKGLIHDRINDNDTVVVVILVLAVVERWRLLATGTLRAGDRHALINALSITFSLLATLIPFFGCLYFKGGFETFLYFRCCMTVLEIGTINIVAARCLEVVRTSDPLARGSGGARHQSIAWQVFFSAAASILGLLGVWVDRIAVFWSSGVEFYGKYVVLSGAVLFAAGIVNAVSQAFLPTLVRSVKGVGESPVQVWQDQVRVSLVLCAPVCAFLFVDPTFVREFFFGQAAVPTNFENIIRCLSLYGYLSALTRIINSFQVAYGRNEIAGAFNVFSAVFYFPTLFVVAYYYGAFGVALGSVAYMTIFLVCFMYVTDRILKNFPGRDMIVRAVSYFVGMAVFLVILGAGTKLFPGGLPTRIACAIGVILLSMSLLATLDSTARKMIIDFLRGLRLKVFVALS
jgi:O-antigen/teichoic acid export membrane protein